MEGMSMGTLPLLNCEQAAEILGVSPVRVRQFCLSGRLGQKVGSQYVISRDELDQFRKIPRNPGRPTDDLRKTGT